MALRWWTRDEDTGQRYIAQWDRGSLIAWQDWTEWGTLLRRDTRCWYNFTVLRCAWEWQPYVGDGLEVNFGLLGLNLSVTHIFGRSALPDAPPPPPGRGGAAEA